MKNLAEQNYLGVHLLSLETKISKVCTEEETEKIMNEILSYPTSLGAKLRMIRFVDLDIQIFTNIELMCNSFTLNGTPVYFYSPTFPEFHEETMQDDRKQVVLMKKDSHAFQWCLAVYFPLDLSGSKLQAIFNKYSKVIES